MITAHLPSGYVLYRAQKSEARVVLWAALLGAVWPDFDLFWFFFVDDKAFHHHRYWVHAPGFWLICLGLASPLIWRIEGIQRRAALVFFTAWFMHLCLDTIVGEIMWLWPFSTELFKLATVQPTHSHYILSFMAHWSFLFEIAIWIAAGALLLARRR